MATSTLLLATRFALVWRKVQALSLSLPHLNFLKYSNHLFTDCPANSFTSFAGMTACILCAPGYYQDLTGQSTCDTACPPGTYSQHSSNNTQVWTTGAPDIAPLAESSLPNTNLSCIPCPPGYYSNRTASPICKVLLGVF